MKLRDVAVALGVVDREPTANEIWAAKFRASNATSAELAAKRSEMIRRGQEAARASNEALQGTRWCAMARDGRLPPPPKDDKPDDNAKQRGSRPARIVAAYWPEGKAPYRTLERQ